MERPNRPEVGMRVIYGRSNFVRSGWRGTVIDIYVDGYFTVKWDESMAEPTSYRGLAWASTPFRDTFRDRDKHYLFFDEKDDSNERNFPYIFDCGMSKSEVSSTVNKLTTDDVIKEHLSKVKEAENSMKKTMIKQTLINGRIIQEAGEEELISLISSLEDSIRNMETIKAKSNRIAAIIQEKKDAVDEAVKELDSRN